MNKQTFLRIAKYVSISLLTVFIAAVMLGGGLFSTMLARLQNFLKVN